MADGFPYPLVLAVSERISALERDSGVLLTAGARQLLTIPIIEAHELTGRFVEHDVNKSLAQIFDELRRPEHEPFLSPDRVKAGVRSSTSVIRAFHQLFCHIPPFCA